MESRFRKRFYIFCICIIWLLGGCAGLTTTTTTTRDDRITELENKVAELEMLLGTGVGASFYPASGGLTGGGSGALDKRTSTDDKDAAIVALNADHATYPRFFGAYALNVDGAGTEDAPWLIDSGDAGNEDWDLLKGYFYHLAVGGGVAGPGSIEFYEDTSNGANKVTLIGPASTADATLTLQGTTGTVYSTGGTDVADADVADDITITNISQVADITATAAEINTPLDGASVTLTEFQELETIASTTISANQWAMLGGVAETLGAAELNLLDGVTTTATQFNYLNAATGTTGTTSTNVVYSTSPTLVTPSLGTINSGVGTALTALNGENIQNDTIDDDSIDFTDVTCVDLTMTDCTGAIATTGLLSGGVVTKFTQASYTIGTTNANECYGGVIYTDADAIDITACDDMAAGMAFTVYVYSDEQVDLDVQSDNMMILDGVNLDNGDKAVNPVGSQNGSMIVCTYYDSDSWMCISGSPDGTQWSDGG